MTNLVDQLAIERRISTLVMSDCSLTLFAVTLLLWRAWINLDRPAVRTFQDQVM